ncbi:outer membrane protein assembly factor BamB [Sphingomonas insulae]|uniref:SMP-30/gluconolactonase/LRE family protein n=1 Tax=Sphingomonas insulae TaxID=424800 RepID=A0ABN1HN88_9SPHN|nr:hypothetical protein [Sphingomonas insulae]NIJ30899.1 outer membrane protein assembly factor BamB [Sphingomonas insulae]
MPAPLILARIAAIELMRIASPDAHQGAVADADAVYAIANSAITRINKRDGRIRAAWRGDPLRYKHVNSCIVHGRALVCAASNYPDTPMRSQVLWFDRVTMRLERERDLGVGAGSLTWLDRHGGAWWAGFANYDGRGGTAGRDHRATVLVEYTASFVERRRWRFPAAVLDRFAPRSTSGGIWGDDGLLYVTGHDRPELYVLRTPCAGDTLDLVETIATPTGGQAIGWDGADHRRLWSIDRAGSQVVLSALPGDRPARRRCS